MAAQENGNSFGAAYIPESPAGVRFRRPAYDPYDNPKKLTRMNSGDSLSALALALSVTVRDLTASLKWYTEVLGFDVDQKFEREGVLRSVRVRSGNVAVLLNQDDGKKGWDRIKGQGVALMITTANSIDDIASRAKANGGTLDSDPVDTPWGVRMFQLKDPDGIQFTISSERRPPA